MSVTSLFCGTAASAVCLGIDSLTTHFTNCSHCNGLMPFYLLIFQVTIFATSQNSFVTVSELISCRRACKMCEHTAPGHDPDTLCARRIYGYSNVRGVTSQAGRRR